VVNNDLLVLNTCFFNKGSSTYFLEKWASTKTGNEYDHSMGQCQVIAIPVIGISNQWPMYQVPGIGHSAKIDHDFRAEQT